MEGRRKREEGRGKREEGSRKRGNEAEPLDIYSQAESGNKESKNLYSVSVGGQKFDNKRFQSPRKRGIFLLPSSFFLLPSSFFLLPSAVLLIFPAVWHCGAGHTCSIDTSAIYISIAEVGIGKIGISQVGKSQVCTV